MNVRPRLKFPDGEPTVGYKAQAIGSVLDRGDEIHGSLNRILTYPAGQWYILLNGGYSVHLNPSSGAGNSFSMPYTSGIFLLLERASKRRKEVKLARVSTRLFLRLRIKTGLFF